MKNRRVGRGASIILGAGVAASLAACGGGSSDNSTGAAPTVKSSTTTAVSPAPPSQASPSAVTLTKTVQAPGGVAGTTAGAQAKTPAQPAVRAAAPGTHCHTQYRPNGHEDWNASVGRNVSIEFCTTVAKAAMANKGYDDEFDVQAFSPTGRYVTMRCERGEAHLTCSGGNDAVVKIGLNTGF